MSISLLLAYLPLFAHPFGFLKLLPLQQSPSSTVSLFNSLPLQQSPSSTVSLFDSLPLQLFIFQLDLSPSSTFFNPSPSLVSSTFLSLSTLHLTFFWPPLAFSVWASAIYQANFRAQLSTAQLRSAQQQDKKVNTLSQLTFIVLRIRLHYARSSNRLRAPVLLTPPQPSYLFTFPCRNRLVSLQNSLKQLISNFASINFQVCLRPLNHTS